jgi:hypothetical protein
MKLKKIFSSETTEPISTKFATILKGDHLRIISANLVEIGSVVSEEKIFFNFIPLFSNLHNRSKSAKCQSS